MKIKTFIPYDSFIMRTPLSRQEVAKRLKTHTEERKSFRLAQVHSESFEGEVDDSSFSINRIAHFNKSIYPVVEGDIESTTLGTAIKIKIYPNLFSILFAAVWFGFLALFIVWNLISQPLRNIPQLVLPLFMAIAAGVMINWSFWPEAKIIKTKIIEILSAKIHSDTECLSCGKPMPIDTDKCPHCGWTYKK
jgi:hypothetical protein